MIMKRIVNKSTPTWDNLVCRHGVVVEAGVSAHVDVSKTVVSGPHPVDVKGEM